MARLLLEKVWKKAHRFPRTVSGNIFAHAAKRHFAMNQKENIHVIT